MGTRAASAPAAHSLSHQNAMSSNRSLELALEVLPQPDDSTCGPTCLQAVYTYWDLELSLDEVIASVPALPEGGTLAATLACDALRKGFDATIYTYNLQTFDPSWFPATEELADRLRRQQAAKNDAKLSLAIDTYLEFLRLGGVVKYETLNADLLRSLLDKGTPILTGLSATYLYNCQRELNDQDDDVRGEPTGHFVVLYGYDEDADMMTVADPHQHTYFDSRHYPVKTDRLIAAILLGIVTYDANLLIIAPKPADS